MLELTSTKLLSPLACILAPLVCSNHLGSSFHKIPQHEVASECTNRCLDTRRCFSGMGDPAGSSLGNLGTTFIRDLVVPRLGPAPQLCSSPLGEPDLGLVFGQDRSFVESVVVSNLF